MTFLLKLFLRFIFNTAESGDVRHPSAEGLTVGAGGVGAAFSELKRESAEWLHKWSRFLRFLGRSGFQISPSLT